ncbi:hypothetical protein [uncultured Cellulomonas sp.]|uniref:hypothetical protein n=1 Tax=uncultured Cellulomonas sp. TaxID=189682 RepID=UPI00261AB675|nr:hypothetical protein [uncultured Cellulomonas sp.]
MTFIDHNLRVEYATHYAENFVDQLLDNLSGHHPAASVTAHRHWVQVHITIPARDLTDAFSRGLALAQSAGAPVPVLAVEVLSTEEFDARIDA